MTEPDYSRLTPEDWKRDQDEKRESITKAGTTAVVTNAGRPVVLLTVRGRRSGTRRTFPVMRVEHEGRYAVVASRAGGHQNPVWYLNIVANPAVELQDGASTRSFVAREVTGEEKQTWWARAVAAYHEYAEYRSGTDRDIPLLVLEPLG